MALGLPLCRDRLGRGGRRVLQAFRDCPVCRDLAVNRESLGSRVYKVRWVSPDLKARLAIRVTWGPPGPWDHLAHRALLGHGDRPVQLDCQEQRVIRAGLVKRAPKVIAVRKATLDRLGPQACRDLKDQAVCLAQLVNVEKLGLPDRPGQGGRMAYLVNPA